MFSSFISISQLRSIILVTFIRRIWEMITIKRRRDGNRERTRLIDFIANADSIYMFDDLSRN